jgi:hypothetical protein
MELSAYMQKTGKSVSGMAGEIGVSAMALRYWLTRKRIPRPGTMSRIVAATGGAVGPADFYDTEAAQ